MAVDAEWMPSYVASAGTFQGQGRSRSVLKAEATKRAGGYVHETSESPDISWLQRAIALGREATAIAYAREATESLDVTWLNQAMELGCDQFELEHLTDMISELEKAMHGRRFDLLSKAIAAIPFDAVSTQVAITALRVTSVARFDINTWSRAVDGAFESFASRGLDAARLLRGLR